MTRFQAMMSDAFWESLLLFAVLVALLARCTAAARVQGDDDESCGPAVISVSRSSVVFTDLGSASWEDQ